MKCLQDAAVSWALMSRDADSTQMIRHVLSSSFQIYVVCRYWTTHLLATGPQSCSRARLRCEGGVAGTAPCDA